MTTEQTFDKPTAAGFIAVSVQTLDDLLREGVIEAVGTDKDARISLAALRAYLARFRATKPEKAATASLREQEAVLQRLSDEHFMELAAIQGTSPLDPYRIHATLDALEEQGLIERRPDPFIPQKVSYRRIAALPVAA